MNELFIPAGDETRDAPFLVVLGTAQDGGYPQAACRNPCCRRAWDRPVLRRRVVCLAIVEPRTGHKWLLDCTPDFRDQFRELQRTAPSDAAPDLDGILLTHAHVGHYAGLIQLGREVMSAPQVPAHVMPRMRAFLENNQPWRRLVSDGNIALHDLAHARELPLGERIRVTPFQVPHRDEHSETVGFRIAGPDRSAVYVPDIDAWEEWDTPIEEVLSGVDVAFLDGTFYSDGELPGRDLRQIRHPRIADSIERFAILPGFERNKVRFLHFNHTNPVLDPQSREARRIRDAGHHLAADGETLVL